MTSEGDSSTWRPLAVLAVLVTLAHALALQATPMQLIGGPQPDPARSKALVTRSIAANIAPPVIAEPHVAPSPRPKTPAVVKAAKTTPPALNNQSDTPLTQVNSAQTAPEIIAEPPPAPDQPSAQSMPNATPTLAAAVPQVAISSPVAVPAPATVAAANTTPINAVSLPGPVRLLYKVVGVSNNMNYQANAELAWKTNGDSYDAVMKVSAFLIGSRSMTSVGKITDRGLAPTRFADKFRNELAAHFQADKGKITFSANTPDATWAEGAQDRVSVFFQLGGVLAANPAGFPGGSNITFLTVGPRDADAWTFVIELEEDLQLMGAPMQTLKLTRKPRKEFDQKVEIWYAPSLGYLPVRNRITQHSGDFIDQQLVEIVKL